MSLRTLALLCLVCLTSRTSFSAGPNVDVTVSEGGGGFIVDATIDAPVAVQTAWEVLVDFDHMTAVMSDLTTSRVVSREGHVLIVKQEGVAKYGWLWYSFQSEREISLDPMKRIVAKNLPGTVDRMEGETKLTQTGGGVQIKSHAIMVPDSIFARMFGASFVRHEIEEQFTFMVAEMKRREARLTLASPQESRGLSE